MGTTNGGKTWGRRMTGNEVQMMCRVTFELQGWVFFLRFSKYFIYVHNSYITIIE
jgi:hypothetical protein